ncbi:DUF588 domain-containing protein [Cephalotus follicularis]|uniref:CASP-like protein n=1 Tax=Cephalotus follicularis TaxID=3775 RepID=A0A1Q3D3Z8_CEPFO|nr:DUF588 domain-containing protein [Cephalotus follicularis]
MRTRTPNTTTSMKTSSSSNSESQTHLDSPHSPLRFHSPLRSDLGDPPDSPPYSSPQSSPDKLQPPKPHPRVPEDNSKAIVAVDKFTQYSPHPSPLPPPQKPLTENAEPKSASLPPVMVYNRAVTVRDEGGLGVRKVGPAAAEGRSTHAVAAIGGSRRADTMKMATLGFRLSEVVLCLISFSVLAADKTQGWSGDSFDRYKEYRYCLTVNVIAFVYSGFQAYDVGYCIATGKHVIRHHLRHHFDFFMDQILAYLLISAASSAATRVDDWQSNWGRDEFTEMASASVAMAFLAFIAFAISSLISGSTRDFKLQDVEIHEVMIMLPMCHLIIQDMYI